MSPLYMATIKGNVHMADLLSGIPANVPNISANEAHISTKEPYTSAKEPHKSAKEPYVMQYICLRSKAMCTLWISCQVSPQKSPI